MMPLDLVLDRLDGVRQRGEGYQALCPAHDDNEPSLSVAEGGTGGRSSSASPGANLRTWSPHWDSN
jgi:hypothetical protein